MIIGHIINRTCRGYAKTEREGRKRGGEKETMSGAVVFCVSSRNRRTQQKPQIVEVTSPSFAPSNNHKVPSIHHIFPNHHIFIHACLSHYYAHSATMRPYYLRPRLTPPPRIHASSHEWPGSMREREKE